MDLDIGHCELLNGFCYPILKTNTGTKMSNKDPRHAGAIKSTDTLSVTFNAPAMSRDKSGTHR